jgi:hypothetical protein
MAQLLRTCELLAYKGVSSLRQLKQTTVKAV